MKLDVSRCTLSSFFKCSLVLGRVVILQAGDQKQVKHEQESQAASEEGVKISAANTKADVVTVSAKSLTQVAGQATLPVDADLNPVTVPDDAKAFIGRYHTEIDCDGRFAPCTEGKAEFIDRKSVV